MAIALRNILPSLRLNPSLQENNMPHSVQVHIIHTITGHSHIGAYYTRFVPNECPSCPCGEELQTHEHIISDCKRYNASRYILHRACPNLSPALLLSTRKGLSALAHFLKDTDAFTKTQPESQPQTTLADNKHADLPD
jgi:hypothetical protein